MWTIWLTSGTRGGTVGNCYGVLSIQILMLLFVLIVDEIDVIHM
jgi:hypothetical protein